MHGNTRHWLNFNRNFDWFGESLVTVFIVGTQDNWQQVLYAATDSGGVGKGLERHAQEWIFVFFLLMILMVAFKKKIVYFQKNKKIRLFPPHDSHGGFQKNIGLFLKKKFFVFFLLMILLVAFFHLNRHIYIYVYV